MKREFLFTIFLGIFILLTNWVFSQTSISGIINTYTAIDSIYSSKDTIEVADASSFSINDTVMVYQVKGAEPVTEIITNPYNFGSVRLSGINEAGKYEIILVKKIEGNKIIFKAKLNNNYLTDELVQLIRVPSFKNVSINSELTCDPWNGITGGVTVLMVSDTLFFNADINVSSKGFRGAIPFESNGECASIDSAIYGSQFFNENRDTISAGFKGEGIAKFDTSYRKGLGRWANGGGGANGRFAGGGGGGNDGNGGYGGEEDTTACFTPAYETNVDYDGYWNALGGSDGFGLWQQIDDSTIFMGGGGGSGTFTTGLSASSGGNGGGIVIIIAKIIKSNGNNIIAKGVNVAGIAEASGAGGGAGGTIVFDVDSVIGNLEVSTRGGAGGKVQLEGKSGPGGGGGGGPVLWNSIRPDNVIFDGMGGYRGYVQELWPDSTHVHKAKSGSSGTDKLNVKVPLTGFLFNSITSDQQVCMNSIPDLISGSEPRGGINVFTFQWKDSPDGTTWSDIIGETERDYQPPALSDTIYYQRIVTSGSVVDEGNIVQMIVHDYVVDNSIFGDDLITCIGNEADTITGTEVILGGNYVSYQYIWESRTDEGLWNPISPISNTVCLPGIVMDTTYVRRIVISGGCYDTTAVPIEIIGLPQISNNVLSSDQEICEGQIPEEIIGGNPQDGDGIYTVYWEKKLEGENWSEILDSNRNDFAPQELTETTYYRRTVESDDCSDISNEIKINVLIPIDNDSIITESLIYTCNNTSPQIINGSTPSEGDGTYKYQWQKSVDGLVWTNISSTDVEDYQPDALSSKTYFRRLVSSGLNGCCTSSTDSIIVDIYPLPVGVISEIEDTICSGEGFMLEFTLNSGKAPYDLIYSNGETNFNEISSIDGLHTVTVSPETSDELKIYDYTIVSIEDANNCIATNDITGLTKVNVYGLPTTDAGIDDENCLLAYQLAASTSLGTGVWTQFSGDGSTDFENEMSAVSNLMVNNADEYKYVWKETNWKCADADTVNIRLYEQAHHIRLSPIDTVLYFIDEMLLKGSLINPDKFDITTTWEILEGSGGIEPTVNDSIIVLKDLNDMGNPKIIFSWTVEKGVCDDTTANGTIGLKEMFTPSGFTPNGDGVNDYLKFNGIENSDENELIIYNRWGTEIYRMKNYSNDMGWDGKNDKGNELPEDTYYYILNVTDDGILQTHKGFFVIKRF